MTIKKSDGKSLEITTKVLKDGGVVILPTDTVYGFSGITSVGETDKKIMAIKGREESKPLIQLIAEPNDIFKYTDDKIPKEIISKWPGAFSIIVNIKNTLPLYKKQKTVAFRCPGDEWLRKIIKVCDCPIFSTSVNRSGKPVLDEEEIITREFEAECNLIVLDGDKKNALPSTLLSIENGKVKILRQGSVTF